MIAFIVAVAVLAHPTFSWPPSGTGDFDIPDETVTGDPSAAWTADLLGTIHAINPQVGNEMDAAISSGAVFIGFKKGGSSDIESGKADNNTMLFDDSLRSDINSAAALAVHEWEHVRQFNDMPGDPSPDDPACQQAYAYLAQASFMCAACGVALSAHPDDDTGKYAPYTCAQLEFVQNEAQIASLNCTLSTGDVPPDPCDSFYCKP